MAKMAMLVIAFEDLKKPVETSYSGYCASHPPLALPENLESRRYREVWFPDTLFFLPFRHTHIHHSAGKRDRDPNPPPVACSKVAEGGREL